MGTENLYKFTNGQITRFQQSAENKFTIERNTIIDRISLALVAGQKTYLLPDYVQSIRRMTYLGWEIWPLDKRELRLSYLSGTQQSRPYWYIYNGVPTSSGQLQFDLFPVPSMNVTAIPSLSYTDLWGPGIISHFIIEFFRTPDFTSSTQNRVPPIFMSTLANMYTQKRCYAIDGQYNNLKAVDFWQDIWHGFKGLCIDGMDELNNKPRNLVASDASSRPYGFLPPPPILPQRQGDPNGSSAQAQMFGISVDEPSW